MTARGRFCNLSPWEGRDEPPKVGTVSHVLNRANERMKIFRDDGDYETFENVLLEAVERTETRLRQRIVE